MTKAVKECFIRKTNNGKYSWDTNNGNKNCTKCILSVYYGREVDGQHLFHNQMYGIITTEEYESIKRFDALTATEEDVEIIQGLSSRLNVTLKEKSSS
jgi:hypothetical protein